MKKLILLLTLVIAYCSANAGWIPMGSGLSGKVRALTVFNNEIYAGGDFTSPAHVAKWNGSSWVAVGNGLNNSVNVLAVHNNKLYAGGAFTADGSGATTIKYIAVLNNGNWEEVGGGLNNPVNALLSDAAGLYVGGTFVVAGSTTVGRIALYNGSAWSQVGTVPAAGYVNAIAKYNNEIYIAGTFTGYMAKLSGGSWVTLSGGLNNEVLTLSVFKNTLYIGGRFNSPGQYFSSYSTAGGTVGTAVYALNSQVNTLFGTGLKLFGGGAFTQATSTGQSLGHFLSTTYSGPNNLSAEGSSFNGNINAISYLNGKVIVGGDFTANGSSTMSRVAISDTTIDVSEISPMVLNSTFYPNPASTHAVLRVDTKNAVINPGIMLFDNQFRQISQPFTITNDGHTIEVKIEFNSLAAGQYYYSLTGDDGQNLITDRFIIQ